MKVIDTEREIVVTDLDEAFLQSQHFCKYDGSSFIKRDWLLIYHQLRSIKGYKSDFSKVFSKFVAKKGKIDEAFNECYNDSRAANLNFCGAGNMSKASSNYRARHRDKIGNLAISSTSNKVIEKIITFCNKTEMLNGRELLAIMEELDRNKYIADDYKYYDGENGLLIIHANLLLWVNKYAPNYVTDYVGNCIGKRWSSTLN